MRCLAVRFAVASLAVAAVGLLSVQPALGADALAGKWKLVLPTISDEPLFIFDIDASKQPLTGTIVAAQDRLFEKPELSELKQVDKTLRVELKSERDKNLFVGLLPDDAAADKPILGTFLLNGRLYPAQIERTDASAVGPLQSSRLQSKVILALRGVDDPKEKLTKLRELLHELKTGPGAGFVYTEIIRNAELAELTPDEVREFAMQWVGGAAAYGPAWETETQIRLITLLLKQKKYAEVTCALAGAAQESLPDDATISQRAAIAGGLAEAATACGKTEIATEARDLWQKLEGELDDEYLKSVPPFKVEPFAGRDDAQHNRVVLMELFTGAQCPPCVAADVGFDALLETYKPTELIGLQYHLHIPGPDPLTNPDTLARSKYYDVHGTPSTYFNGKSAAGGGGGMADSKTKYDEYVEIINSDLMGQREAGIDLKLARTGNVVSIRAAADVDFDAGEGQAADAAAQVPAAASNKQQEKTPTDKEAPAAEEPPAASLRLRLVLVQEVVRFAGGNRLRFHHHVVRGMPGGAEGKELVDGKCQVELSMDLDQIRGDLEAYLKEYAATREFPQTPPAIDQQGLSVVALVQDDSDKRVLNAVIVPLPAAP